MKLKTIKSLVAAAMVVVGFTAAADDLGGVQLWAGGPFWAECNLGATKPQEYGGYTAFAKTSAAVTEKLGEGWRMPTAEEFAVMTNEIYCTTTWTTDYNGTGVKGFFVTSNADPTKSIFLPAAGASWGEQGTQGYYWTSTPNPTNSEQATALKFRQNQSEGKKFYLTDTQARGYEMSIRPVRSAPPITVTLDAQGGTGGTTSVGASVGSAMPNIAIPFKADNVFLGYFDADEGGKQYYDGNGASAANWDKDGDATLYAQWMSREQFGSLSLGAFDNADRTFADASGTGVGKFDTLTIYLGRAQETGDSVTLPTVDGYSPDSANSTDYTIVVNISPAKTAGEVASEYLNKVEFTCAKVQSVNVVLSKGELNKDIFYFAENGHYYRYVKFSSGSQTWAQAYDAARNTFYGGWQGYLATVTSLAEDLFIYKASQGSIGWLGGTILKPGTQNGQYYDSFTLTRASGTSHYHSHWYWACGPERGEMFYDVHNVDDLTDKAEAHARNITAGRYHNWSAEEPNHDYEACVTTLPNKGGYSTAETIDKYSWNNIPYDNDTHSDYTAQGYLIEFGDQKSGDSHGEVLGTKISAVGTVTPITVTLDAQGGEGGTASVGASVGIAMPAITIPTKTGYRFAGYFDETVGGVKYYNADGTSAKTWDKTENTTLYAQWDAIPLVLYVDPVNATTNSIANYLPVTKDTAEIGGGNWYVVSSDVSRGSINVSGTAYLIVCDGATLALTGTEGKAGLQVNIGNTLYIYGQENNSGKLVLQGGTNAPGLGSANQTGCGTIFVNGCRICSEGGGDKVVSTGVGRDGNKDGPNTGEIIINGGTFDAGDTYTSTSIGLWGPRAVEINGGSLYAKYGIHVYNGQTEGHNSTDAPVYCVTTAIDVSDDTACTVRGLGGLFANTKIYPQNGKLYFYLPNGSYTYTVNDVRYKVTVNGKDETARAYSLVTLDVQGGEGGTASVEASVGSAMPAITIPTKTGYRFAGYFDSVGKQYYDASGKGLVNWDKTESTTLTAKWNLAATERTDDYRPTTIVNGDFSTEPWMNYTYGGKRYTECPDVSGGYVVSNVEFHGVDEGWNTTEIETYDSSLFEFTCRESGAHSVLHNSTISRTEKYVEMNCSKPAILYQDLTTHEGDIVRWSLNHGVRTGDVPDQTQSMRVEVGAPLRDADGKIVNATGTMDSIDSKIDANGKALFRCNGVTDAQGSTSDIGFAGSDIANLSLDKTANANGWWPASGVYIIPDGQTVTRFGFVSEAENSPGMGNLLDNVEFSTLLGNLGLKDNGDGSATITGYWGDDDATKRLAVEIGEKTYYVDMGGVLDKNFTILIPPEWIGDALEVTVYHEDYPSAAKTLKFVVTVTLDAQGGEGGTASVTATYGEPMPSPVARPAKTGYTFLGYFDAPAGVVRWYDARGVSTNVMNFTADTTLYAQWKANSYKYVLDGGSFTGEQAVVYGELPKNLPRVPVAGGKTFLGYFDKDGNMIYDASGKCVVETPYLTVGDTTLVARWDDRSETVELVAAKQRWPWNGKVDVTYAADSLKADRSYVIDVELTVVEPGANDPVTRSVRVAIPSENGEHALVADFGGAGVVAAETFDENATVRLRLSGSVIDGLGGVQLWAGGPFWAECNLGATKPQDYGWYFWWGDTVGYKRSGSSWVSVLNSSVHILFNVDDATAKSSMDMDAAALFEKGWIDRNGNLTPEHDAATVKLGAPWRVMTQAEVDVLTNTAYCTTVWTDNYNGSGVAGRIVTGATAGYTDKSIFLPAAGYGDGNYFQNPGEKGWYFSSTPTTGSTTSPWRLDLASGYFQRSSNWRCHGYTVRPVRSAPVVELDVSDAKGIAFDVREVKPAQVFRPETLTSSPKGWEADAETATILEAAGEGTPVVVVETVSANASVWTPQDVGLFTLTHKAGASVETALFNVTGFTYRVEFDANGGTGEAMASIDLEYGKEGMAPSCSYVRQDYAFDGWNTRKDGTGTEIAEGGAFSNLVTSAEEVGYLYAQWRVENAVQYEVSVTEGGEPKGEPIKVPTVWIEENLPETDPKNPGDVKEKLEEKDETGLKTWHKYVLGVDTTEKDAKVWIDSPQQKAADKIKVKMREFSPTKGTGFVVKYRLDTELKGQAKTKGELAASPDFDIDLTDDMDPTGLYTINVVFIPEGKENSDEVVESVNTMGILKVPSPKRLEIVAVPWNRLAPDENQAVLVADLVKTAALTPGDKLHVYDRTKRSYKSWSYVAEKGWVALGTFKVSASGLEQSMAPDQTEQTVERGSAVWLERQDVSKPFYLYGQHSKNEVETAVVRNQHNLVAPPTMTAFHLNAEGKITGEINAKDQIIVPQGGDNPPKVYTYRADRGGWGYTSVSNGRPVFRTDDDEVPAGTGFWYVSKGGYPVIRW